jgi:hypothetical protein
LQTSCPNMHCKSRAAERGQRISGVLRDLA